MEIEKATITAAMTGYQYNNTAAASAFCTSTKTCDKKAFQIEKRLCLHCLVHECTPPPQANIQNFHISKLILVIVKCPASITPALKVCPS